jgi:hypothetical protein
LRASNATYKKLIKEKEEVVFDQSEVEKLVASLVEPEQPKRVFVAAPPPKQREGRGLSFG